MGEPTAQSFNDDSRSNRGTVYVIIINTFSFLSYSSHSSHPVANKQAVFPKEKHHVFPLIPANKTNVLGWIIEFQFKQNSITFIIIGAVDTQPQHCVGNGKLLYKNHTQKDTWNILERIFGMNKGFDFNKQTPFPHCFCQLLDILPGLTVGLSINLQSSQCTIFTTVPIIKFCVCFHVDSYYGRTAQPKSLPTTTTTMARRQCLTTSNEIFITTLTIDLRLQAYAGYLISNVNFTTRLVHVICRFCITLSIASQLWLLNFRYVDDVDEEEMIGGRRRWWKWATANGAEIKRDFR